MTSQPLKVLAGSPDKPLRIGEIEIQCYVLEGEVRVLTQRGLLKALNMGRGSAGGDGDRLSAFVAGQKISPFISNELKMVIQAPLTFLAPKGGQPAFGYPAVSLPDICDAVLTAREQGALQAQQAHIAQRCELLVRGLSRVGIVALVDEATGYQNIRARRALAELLEQWLMKELQAWTKTFPEEFYVEMFRLKGWSYPALADGQPPARPGVVGTYTVDLVYQRLPPGIWMELKRKEPISENGRRKNKLHQWFSPSYGHPKLKEHIAAIMALMRVSDNWWKFMRNVNRAFPKQEQQWELPLPDDDEDDKAA